MAESTPGGTQSPSAAPADLAAIVAEAVALALTPLNQQLTELAQNQKVLGDTVAGSKTMGADDVARTVSDLLDKRGLAQASGDRRKTFVAEKLKGVPEAYHGQLGDNEGEWAAKAGQIRERLKADMTSIGATIPEVAGDRAAAAGSGSTAKSPTVSTDLSKLSADQKIALGLKARAIPATVAPSPALANQTPS